MYRRGYERDFEDMELEMMRREMMYRYGDDLDPEELEELLMEMKPSEEEIKRRDRQELVYWINSQMLPPTLGWHHNHHDLHGLSTSGTSCMGVVFSESLRDPPPPPPPPHNTHTHTHTYSVSAT